MEEDERGNLKSEVSCAKKGLWNTAKKRILEDRGALLEEEGDLIREYNAMQKENFLSSWLRDSTGDEADKREKVNREEAKEEGSKHGMRKLEGEMERVPVVCERTCYESHSGMNSEEEEVDFS